MAEYSRRGFLAGSAAAVAALSGCTGEKGSSDDIEDVVNEINFYQKERLEDYNNIIRDDGFNEEEVHLETDPSNLEGEDDIDYQVIVETKADGPYSDLTDMDEISQRAVERGLAVESAMAAAVDPHLYISVLGVHGEADLDTEAYQDYTDRLGAIGVEVRDQAGNSARLELGEGEVEELWNSVDKSLERDEKEDSHEEIRRHARENMEVNGWDKIADERLEEL